MVDKWPTLTANTILTLLPAFLTTKHYHCSLVIVLLRFTYNWICPVSKASSRLHPTLSFLQSFLQVPTFLKWDPHTQEKASHRCAWNITPCPGDYLSHNSFCVVLAGKCKLIPISMTYLQSVDRSSSTSACVYLWLSGASSSLTRECPAIYNSTPRTKRCIPK